MVGKAIYKLLKDDAGVGAICADRIYPQYAPQGAAMPFITYDIISTIPLNSKGNTSHIDSFRVQVNCIASTYLSAHTLAEAVRAELDGYSGTPAGTGVTIRNTLFADLNDLLEEEDTWGVAIDFIIHVKN